MSATNHTNGANKTNRTDRRVYDAIVVGARCAGAPTAMLLARKGHDVLLIDRASFPSDTVSTHVIHAQGVAALARWGLLDPMVASGCPAIESYSFDFGPFVIKGFPQPVEGISAAYAPRRTVLDDLLVGAAREAGVEVRERFTFTGVVEEGSVVVGISGRDRDGNECHERARVVIGADGRNSQVAAAVRAPAYDEKPFLQWGCYSYWRDLPVDGFETVIRPERGWAAAPTNDGLTMLVVGCPYAEAQGFRADVEGNYLATLELAPAFAERVRGATRVERFYSGTAANYFRRPYGPGWALVGDAGHNRDSITAQGISNAFLDAERCAGAVDAALAGGEDYTEAMAAYQRSRDESVLAMYEFTAELATLEPPPPPVQQLLAALSARQEGMDAFVSVMAGTLSPVDFFDPAHIAGLLGPVPAGAPA